MATRDTGDVGVPWVITAERSGRGMRVSLYRPGDDVELEGDVIGEILGNPREMGRQLQRFSKSNKSTRHDVMVEKASGVFESVFRRTSWNSGEIARKSPQEPIPAGLSTLEVVDGSPHCSMATSRASLLRRPPPPARTNGIGASQDQLKGSRQRQSRKCWVTTPEPRVPMTGRSKRSPKGTDRRERSRARAT